MARPKKNKNIRTSKFTVHCSAAEKLKIQMYADRSGLSKSEYARGKALLKSVLDKDMNDKVNGLIRMGNNLNQIAKKLNQGHDEALKARDMIFQIIDVIENDC